jgi:hypothetical protein
MTTIILVVLLVILILVTVVLVLARKFRGHIHSTARRLLDNIRSHFPPEHEIRLLHPEDLPEEGREQIEEAGNALKRAGGKFIGDFEVVTLRPLVGCCVPIRSYCFPGMGFEAAAYYHPKVGCLTYDLSSHFSDGRYFTTSNAELAGKLNSPPGILSLLLPGETPLDQLIRIHTERLTAAWLENPKLELNVWTTPEEIIAREQQIARIKYQHRARNGWVSEEEVERLCSPQDKWAAKEIHAAIQKILLDEGSR